MIVLLIFMFEFVVIVKAINETNFSTCFNSSHDCSTLLMGQYFCDDPEIDPNTQAEVGCSKNKHMVEVLCYPAPGICCNNIVHTGTTIGFKRNVTCNYTNGTKFTTALLLSIFLGWLGIDRFYLGYPALGLLKFSTFGMMLIWTLVDIFLIALQIVKPSDGSKYVLDYYGPVLTHISKNNMTFLVPPY